MVIEILFFMGILLLWFLLIPCFTKIGTVVMYWMHKDIETQHEDEKEKKL
jgi:hypothetical protein